MANPKMTPKASDDQIQPDGGGRHVLLSDDSDVEGHGVTKHPKAADDQLGAEGFKKNPKASDDSDVEGHMRVH